MNQRIQVKYKNAADYFCFQAFISPSACSSFDCGISEYNEYLMQDALRSMNDHIALTWLLSEHSTGKIAAYMSLIMDAIKLSFTEKELHNLNYPFRTIPAMKIAKLAVDSYFSEKYKGIGTFMIDSAERLALACNTAYCACRFLTVDADIEHNGTVIEFYQKNGFVPNAEMNGKRTKTISMRKDIFA
jgi:ribosomal protein S18 acetylase RimI-like enzyme